MKHITISQFNYMLFYLPVYVAEEKGLFSHPIVFQNKYNDDAVVEDVYKKKADISLGDPVISALDRYCEDIVAVGCIINHFAIWAITLNPLQEPFSTVHDFVEKKVSCYPTPTTAYYLFKHVLEKNNLVIEKDVQTVAVRPGRELGALYGGEVDVGLVLHPVLSQAISNGAKPVLSLHKYYGNMTISGFTVRKTIDKKLLRSFLSGVQQGINIIFSDTQETFRIAKQYFPDVEDRSLLHAIEQLRKQGWTQSLAIDEKEWQTALAIRRLPKTRKTYTNNYVGIIDV